ncbi:MAG TPA: hypothetical protein PKH05_19125, partial [Nitrospira sp.]|nr:hypothetical protein [Nitrospira sp.]
MPSIADYVKYAETSFAAYAVGLANGIGVNAQAFIDANMSPTQAQRFDASWQVLGQQDIWDGFSAVLLQPVDTQGNPSGQKVLAIRGTEASHWGIDYLADVVNITLLGTNAGMRQYASLQDFYLTLIAQGKLGATEEFVVTGHSLGGFLAQAFAASHVFASAAFTFNAPGFSAAPGVIPNFGTELLKLFGLSGTIPNDKIFNVRALEGLSATAGLGQMIGSVQTFNIEGSGNPISNHSITTLTDALAVYDVVARIEPNASLDTIGALVKASSAKAADTLEALTGALGKLLLATPPTIATGDRDALYRAIADIRRQLDIGPQPQRNIVSLTTLSAADLIVAAGNPDAVATRYALRELNPFAVLGDDSLYTKFNGNHELDLYSAETGRGLSPQW